MNRFIPRSVPAREKKIIVDALLRAAAETRATIARAAQSKTLDQSTVAKHRETLEALAADQARLAANLDDSSLELALVAAHQQPLPHERAGSGVTINRKERRR